MKSVFFNAWGQSLYDVYSAEQCERLKKFGIADRIYDKSDLPEMRDVEYVFSTWGMVTLAKEEIRKFMPRLKAVFYAAGSVKYFAEPFLDCGVKVFSAWKANAVPVAEYAVSQILLANKGFYSLSRLCRNDYEAARERMKKYVGNFGAKVGILGFGAIGRLVTEELVKKDLDVYVFAPDITEEQAKKLGVAKAGLADIFRECDVVSNHIADNAETKGIINAELLDSMKPYSTFINTGRGAQVNEAALIARLRRDETFTAVLDVTDPEPPLADSGFYTLDNAVITPHIAGSSGKEINRLAAYAIEQAERFAGGEECDGEVTKEMLVMLS